MTDCVFDTNVVLQAMLNEAGPAAACFDLIFNNKASLITTDAILDEIADVITRPRLLSRYPILRSERPAQFLEKIRSVADVVKPPPTVFDFERDRTDEVFLNLALGYLANYLVSRDRDLLDLMDDSEFRERFPRLQVVSPVGFLEAVRAV